MCERRSPEGAEATRNLEKRLASFDTASLLDNPTLVGTDLDALQAEFETAVEIYAGDGYHFRRRVQGYADASYRNIGIAAAFSAVIVLVITLALWTTIVPALRKAVDIARSISAGNLDNRFPIDGSDETAILLRAMSDMQDSLKEKIGRIGALAGEAQARAAELVVQNARFEAALDNMHHGLCMIDDQRRLVVANHRFAAMFGAVAVGSDAEQWSLFSMPHDAFAERSPTVETLSDGRMIRIACQPVREGGGVVTFEDVTIQHRNEAELRRMARYDALTGLANRVLFRERLSELLADAESGSGLAILYLDLDGFKNINDTLGHETGDELLRSVAARLREGLGAVELIARLGGDEFAVILGSGDQNFAEITARDLIDALRKPFDVPPNCIAIGASLGIAMLRGSDLHAPDVCTMLLKNADVAMYRAKAEGRGTYRIHSDDLDAAFVERRSLERDLVTALERNELVLLFQPIVSVEGGAVTGFEALVRWIHPERGTVSPATFIPVAEQIGLIEAIGQWVLSEACAVAARWPMDLRVAVNLSPVQFRQGFLLADVQRALADADLAPHRLELEITESVLLQDDEAVLATIAQLRAQGVRIALDDFGTGYSSLSYLRRFPIDKLKIDKCFIQNLANEENNAILKAIVDLGHALKVSVVAEGVETEEQAERLSRKGCSELQGFHFGRPGPAADIPNVIRRLNEAGLRQNVVRPRDRPKVRA